MDKYYQVQSNTAVMNCTELNAYTNGIHRSSAFSCGAMALPLASTYNCPREGGTRIRISGEHFGASDAIVTVDGLECTDVVHIVPELELECTLPPASSAWIASPTTPSVVQIRNGRLHGLSDDAPFLSYRVGVSALAAPVVSNVAAHALDLNWRPSSDVWETMTITGYLVEWKKCSATTFDSMVVGNVTSTTVINLSSATAYHGRVTALTENYLQRDEWQALDLYGRRSMLRGAVIGTPSPLTACVSTLASGTVQCRGSIRLEPPTVFAHMCFFSWSKQTSHFQRSPPDYSRTSVPHCRP
ncbi:hypothetical protein PINS_up015171 [Pythium insidiosum]|nr:hypothetical protein PINS_up015171 [Pythium insidiosum]